MGSSAPRAQTVTQRTEIPAWLEGVTRENIARADAISNQPYQPYTGQLIAGFAPEQEAAFQYAAGGVGQTQPYFNAAMNQTAAGLNYQPLSVAPGQVDYQTVNPAAVNAVNIASAPTVQARDVAAQNFLSGNVGAYMNPYIQNVEQAALSRLEGATQQAVNRLGDQALQARAFGGSRQGIAEGIALGEASRSAGELSANLRSQGYNQAAALMQADAQRALQADLANQQANLAAGTTSAQLAQQIALANQAAGMQAGTTSAQLAQQANLANQATGMQAGTFNAQQALQAQQLNQAAGLQGQQLRNQTAGVLSNLGAASQAARQLDTGVLQNIGAQRQAMNQAALDEAYARFQEQRNYPIEMLNLRLGATSATPYSTSQTGTQFVPRGNSFLQGLGAFGSAASGFAALAPLLGFSDERMKTDIQKVGKDEETGLTMYAYRYKGDPKTYPKVVGPMAQEIEKKYPDQVSEISGRKAVNLGFGPMRRAMNNG